MMLKRKLLPVLLGFSILLQAAFFQVAIPNLILCIGDNGHIAFEWRSLSAYGQHDDAPLPALFLLTEKKDSSSSELNCTDINLHFHPSRAEKTQKKSITKFSSKVINTFNLWNPDVTELTVSIKSFKLPLPRLNIGTEQSTVLII